MAFVALGDIALVVSKGQMNGQAVWNTFHYRLDTLVGAITVNNALAGLHTALDQANGLWEALCDASPQNYTVEQIDYQIISPARFMKQTFVPTFDTGTVASTAVTSNLMASITRRGESSAVGNVGGIRVGAPTTAVEATSGEWEPGYITLLETLASEMLQSVVANGGNQIWGPGLFGPWTNPTFKPIVATAVAPQVRVMRRRTVGRGI